MEYFTEQALTHKEAIQKIKMKFGDRAIIMTQRTVPIGGFFGLFAKEGIEITGYLSNNVVKRKQLNVNDEKKKILERYGNENSMDKVLEQLSEIRQKLDKPEDDAQQGALQAVLDKLEENDFNKTYIENIMARVKKELSMDQLDDESVLTKKVAEWITEDISVFTDNVNMNPRIIVLVGPTGVGKTTTIAKLAALFGLDSSGEVCRKVKILTIDNYRIGARKQIEAYGEIMGIPVKSAENFDELQKQIALSQTADIVLIDTIGKSPNDLEKLGQMKKIIDAAGSRAEIHLAISASTKTRDMLNIMGQFEPFGYKAVIITKLDETRQIGNMLSILTERKKPVSFVTTGQSVPNDITRASKSFLMSCIEGFDLPSKEYQTKNTGN